MRKTNTVTLTAERRATLDRLVNSGQESARKITRAWVLLKAADGVVDEAIAAVLKVGVSTVERVRRRFAASGLDAAVERRPQPPRPDKRVLDGAAKRHHGYGRHGTANLFVAFEPGGGTSR